MSLLSEKSHEHGAQKFGAQFEFIPKRVWVQIKKKARKILRIYELSWSE